MLTVKISTVIISTVDIKNCQKRQKIVNNSKKKGQYGQNNKKKVQKRPLKKGQYGQNSQKQKFKNGL